MPDTDCDEAPRLRHVRHSHSHSTMTHSHHTHTTDQHSLCAQHSFRNARDAHEDTQKAAREPPMAYGAGLAPPPPAAQSPTHEAHHPPNLSSSTALAAQATPYCPPKWTHRTTSKSHPLPAATRPATQPHFAHTRPGEERRAAIDSSHLITLSTLSLQLVASLGLP